MELCCSKKELSPKIAEKVELIEFSITTYALYLHACDKTFLLDLATKEFMEISQTDSRAYDTLVGKTKIQYGTVISKRSEVSTEQEIQIMINESAMDNRKNNHRSRDHEEPQEGDKLIHRMRSKDRHKRSFTARKDSTCTRFEVASEIDNLQPFLLKQKLSLRSSLVLCLAFFLLGAIFLSPLNCAYASSDWHQLSRDEARVSKISSPSDPARSTLVDQVPELTGQIIQTSHSFPIRNYVHRRKEI
mmetsp:Transcript_19807/g.27878  ORF Transcript_19807/g.27878 Transcript_19807/m.27878 type:complete len:246 (+) Transcript_19807:170-907(+)